MRSASVAVAEMTRPPLLPIVSCPIFSLSVMSRSSLSISVMTSAVGDCAPSVAVGPKAAASGADQENSWREHRSLDIHHDRPIP